MNARGYCLVGALACATVATISAQAPAPAATQKPNAPLPISRFDPATVIGCLQREGTGANAKYTLTDTRGNDKDVYTYQVMGDAAVLDIHVGSQTELTGEIQGGQNASGVPPAAGDKVPVFKANKVMRLSFSCWTQKPWPQ